MVDNKQIVILSNGQIVRGARVEHVELECIKLHAHNKVYFFDNDSYKTATLGDLDIYWINVDTEVRE